MTNAAFRGLEVEAGHHRVTMCFRPTILYKGAAVSLVALLLAAWAVPSRKPRELIQSGSFGKAVKTILPAAVSGRRTRPPALAPRSRCACGVLCIGPAKKTGRVTADGFPVHSFEGLLENSPAALHQAEVELRTK